MTTHSRLCKMDCPQCACNTCAKDLLPGCAPCCNSMGRTCGDPHCDSYVKEATDEQE